MRTTAGRRHAALAAVALWVGAPGILGCPPPPPPVEPVDDGANHIDLPPPADPEPPPPPPEAGSVGLGPAMMTGGSGMSDEARREAKEAFIATFEQGRHHFRRCYAKGLARSADLAGSVDVEVVLNADGSVYEIKVVSSELADPATVRCVQKAFRKLRYAPLRDGEMFSITPVVKLAPE